MNGKNFPMPKDALRELEIHIERKYFEGKTLIYYSEIERFCESKNQADKVCGIVARKLGITIVF